MKRRNNSPEITPSNPRVCSIVSVQDLRSVSGGRVRGQVAYWWNETTQAIEDQFTQMFGGC